MKIYVATKFDSWKAAYSAQGLLRSDGHDCTSSWVYIAKELKGDCSIVPSSSIPRRNNALLDLADVKRCDALLVLVPEAGGAGMWVEVGMALALGKRVLLVGQGAEERCVFCELCEIYPDLKAARSALSVEGDLW